MGHNTLGEEEEGDDVGHFFNGCETLPKTWLRKGLKKGTQRVVLHPDYVRNKKGRENQESSERRILCRHLGHPYSFKEHWKILAIWKQSALSASWNRPPWGHGTAEKQNSGPMLPCATTHPLSHLHNFQYQPCCPGGL